MAYDAQRPCGGCKEEQCQDLACAQWRQWFLDAWAAVNRYGWAQMDEYGRQEPRRFVYRLPHERKSPCVGCVCEPWCDTPCSRRLQWWDRCVGRR